MANRVLVTTKASEFELRKQEYLKAGYEIEGERPVPVNGRCTFTAVRKTAEDNEF